MSRGAALFAAAVATTTVMTGTPVATGATSTTPATIVLDGAQLAAIKQQLATAPTPAETAALNALTTAANQELTTGPWSVMDKTSTVSTDKHDYYSLATYYWPNPNTANHCPYIHKDGQWGPTVTTTGDLTAWAHAWHAINDLSLAWYYTGNAAYAKRAETDVRTWFLNPATKMNPNMNFAQVVPCTKVGRAEGTLETSQALTQVIDSLALLDSGAPGWSSADHAGMESWLTAFSTWSRTSKLGKAESAATNNHGTWKDLQDAVIALYLGDRTTATKLIGNARTTRIAKQIDANGSQPAEMARTRPWHYANFNAQALCRLAEAGRHVGINLWAYKAPNGATIAKAVDFLIPAATGRSDWTHPDLDVFDPSLALDKIHAAAAEAGDANASAALAKVPAPSGGDLWPIVPACWEDLSQPPVRKG